MDESEHIDFGDLDYTDRRKGLRAFLPRQGRRFVATGGTHFAAGEERVTRGKIVVMETAPAGAEEASVVTA